MTVMPAGDDGNAHALVRWIHRAVARLQRSRVGGQATAAGATRRGADGAPLLRRRHERRIDDVVEGLHARASTAAVGGAAHRDEATALGAASLASPSGVLRLVFSKRGGHAVDRSVPPPVIGSLSGGAWGLATPDKAHGAVAQSGSHNRHRHRKSYKPERLDASAQERHVYVWWRGDRRDTLQVGPASIVHAVSHMREQRC